MSENVKTVTITQDIGGTSYKVKMRKFRPAAGDSMERKWRRNERQCSYECSPYAIANMKGTGKTLAEFSERTLGAAICHYIDETDPLLRDTYAMAYRYSRFAEVSRPTISARVTHHLHFGSVRRREHFYAPCCDSGMPPGWNLDRIVFAAMRLSTCGHKTMGRRTAILASY